MERVDVEQISSFERYACERDHDHECPGLERDCRLVDVPHVRDKSLWREFA
jgi:hypothetical protein